MAIDQAMELQNAGWLTGATSMAQQNKRGVKVVGYSDGACKGWRRASCHVEFGGGGDNRIFRLQFRAESSGCVRALLSFLSN
jgi:hypothetical protein